MRWVSGLVASHVRRMSTTLSVIAPLGSFAFFWLAQVATPGPNFVRISHTALAVSRSAAFATACGTAIGNSIWCAVAAIGAAALIGDGLIGQLLRGFGALYLAAFGAHLLIGATRLRPAASQAPMQPTTAGGLAAIRAGLVTALTNPQAIIFFATIFLATFPARQAWLLATAVVVVAAVTLLWYAVVIGLLSAPTPRRAYERVRPFVDAAFGCLLMSTALRLANAALA